MYLPQNVNSFHKRVKQCANKLPKFDSVKYKAYLVSTDKAQAQRCQHLNDNRATVALDWVVRL